MEWKESEIKARAREKNKGKRGSAGRRPLRELRRKKEKRKRGKRGQNKLKAKLYSRAQENGIIPPYRPNLPRCELRAESIAAASRYYTAKRKRRKRGSCRRVQWAHILAVVRMKAGIGTVLGLPLCSFQSFPLAFGRAESSPERKSVKIVVA